MPKAPKTARELHRAYWPLTRIVWLMAKVRLIDDPWAAAFIDNLTNEVLAREAGVVPRALEHNQDDRGVVPYPRLGRCYTCGDRLRDSNQAISEFVRCGKCLSKEHAEKFARMLNETGGKRVARQSAPMPGDAIKWPDGTFSEVTQGGTLYEFEDGTARFTGRVKLEVDKKSRNSS
jgi:hypothetical protein